MSKINENIKRIRLEKGLTQQEVADQLFVTRQAVSRWENGSTLPDINTIEKLSKIYDCTINDIVDSESVTNLTIQEAIKNKKTKKIVLTSIIVSLSALLFSFMGLFLYYKVKGPTIISPINQEDARVSHLDDNKIIFTTRFQSVSINTSNFLFIYDTYDNLIPFSDLKLDDLVELTYENNLTSTTITKVKKLYSYTTDNFLGIIITSNNKKYDTLNELHTSYDKEGVRYISSDRDYNYSHNFNTELNMIVNYESYKGRRLNHEIIMEVDMHVDIFQLTKNPIIGLIYESGIYYENEIDKNQFNDVLIFEGSYTHELGNGVTYETYKKTFQINYKATEAFIKLEVYEYDINNTLINTVILKSREELDSFKPHEKAIYAYFKEYYNSRKYFPAEYYIYKTYTMNIGESTKLFLPDTYGYIWEYQFNYTPGVIKP